MIATCDYIKNKMNCWIKTDVDSTIEDNTDYKRVVQCSEYLISLAINTKAVIEKSQTFEESLAAFDLLISEMRKNYEIVDDIKRKVLSELGD